MKSKFSVFVLKNAFLFSLMFLFPACGQTKDDQQKYVDGYLKVIDEIKSRQDVIKKGAAAIIAYRKSNFMDLENAEIAREALLEGVRLDSIALSHLLELKAPDDQSKEITMDMKRGIEAVSEGNKLFAANYAKAKNQNPKEREQTILNVVPGLTSMAQGLNAVVVSMKKLDKYITDNDLKGRDDLNIWFKQFKLERDNLASFIKE